MKGQDVEANFEGAGHWHPGVIAVVCDDGKSYDIMYDDGDYEKGVEARRIRPDHSQDEAHSDDDASVGNDSDDEEDNVAQLGDVVRVDAMDSDAPLR